MNAAPPPNRFAAGAAYIDGRTMPVAEPRPIDRRSGVMTTLATAESLLPTVSDFDYVRDLVRRGSAIVLDSNKEYLVEARLEALAGLAG